MNWYLTALKRYADFTGRARRMEYWMFTLFNIIIMIALMILTNVASIFGILYLLYVLAILVPAFAVSVRRLHDTDRSGWWLLISLIPIIGAVVLIIFMVLDSQEGENRFGPNPKSA